MRLCALVLLAAGCGATASNVRKPDAAIEIACLSDWLDGLLARVLNQKSRLGQFLDPAADKLMILVCFLVAAALHAVPKWLAVLVIGRDVVLASGGALFAFVLRGRYPSAR